MIQRRIFLGSVALGLAQLALPRQARAAALGPLNWQCEVVKTTPHTRSRRSPVVTGCRCAVHRRFSGRRGRRSYG